jgi:hypothetical protein
MKKKKQMPKWSFRMEKDTMDKLRNMAYPENVSILIRKILRDFVEKKK